MATETHAEQHHPTPALYVKIAVLLAVLTAVEVGLYYANRRFQLGGLNTALLLVLAALKFVIVIGYYMHLRYDPPTLRRFFASGFALALSIYAVVLAAFGVVARLFE